MCPPILNDTMIYEGIYLADRCKPMNIYDELHERALELVKKWNKFDFENLEYWENNSKWASFMRASESSESDSLCLVYNIFEARMCAYMGRIAVIKDKDNPHLVFTSKVSSYVEISNPRYTNDGRYVLIQVYTHEFAGTLVIDVVNKRYAGIKYPKFMLCKITPMEENEVLFTNLEESNKNDVNERLKLSSLNWQVIENPVVDYIPAFEIYW